MAERPHTVTDLWVFAYGSLMWRPGFAYEEVVPAKLFGAHRALCVWSVAHRGTHQRPGLVLGLDHGGSCRGVAYRVASESGDSVLAYLRKRELVTNVYLEVRRPVVLQRLTPEVVEALLYIVDRRHPQYAGNLNPAEALEIVRASEGPSGPNPEYVINTADHLRSMGIRDAGLEWLATELRSDASAAG